LRVARAGDNAVPGPRRLAVQEKERSMTVKTLLERFAIAIVIGIYLLYGTMDMFRTRYHDYFDLHDQQQWINAHSAHPL